MQTIITKSEIDLISKNLISELRNIDGTSKKVTYASDYKVTMYDATEIMIGQEPVKKFWSIKVFFGNVGKRPFYYHFDKDDYFKLSQYVYSFEIKTKSLFQSNIKSVEEFESCYGCGIDLEDGVCQVCG